MYSFLKKLLGNAFFCPKLTDTSYNSFGLQWSKMYRNKYFLSNEIFSLLRYPRQQLTRMLADLFCLISFPGILLAELSM